MVSTIISPSAFLVAANLRVLLISMIKVCLLSSNKGTYASTKLLFALYFGVVCLYPALIFVWFLLVLCRPLRRLFVYAFFSDTIKRATGARLL